jgi:hypothetical protein
LWGIICLLFIVVVVLVWDPRYITEGKVFVYDRILRSSVVDTKKTPKVKNILNPLRPKMPITNKHKVRVGKDNDCGYVMLDNFEGVQAVYGLGIGGDYSWEKDISHRVGESVDVLMYDPTISPPNVVAPLKFYKLGICGDNTRAKNLLTFEEILKKDGNFDKENMILKIDVEGAEWDAFKTTSQEILEKFSQIVVEFHHMTHLDDDAHYNTMKTVLDKLLKTHEVIHVHACNTIHYLIMGGIPIPDTVEVTYLRKKGWEFGKNTQTYPIKGLDSPDHEGKAEFILPFVQNEFTE